MDAVLFTNARIFDGSGADCFAGEVLVEGSCITRVVPRSTGDEVGSFAPSHALRIDCRGATLMPGLVEAHAHLSFLSSKTRIVRERSVPAEEHLLITAHHARVYLDHGFTSAYSAGSRGPRFEIALKKEIDGGYLPGPRLVASTFERSAYADKVRTGPAALTDFVDGMAREGVQSIKLLLSGDDAFVPGGSQVVEYTEEEVAAAAEQARASGVWLACHAQAAEAVKMAARHGFRIIYHCTYADEEALDLLEARKDEVFVAPAIGVVYAKAYLGAEFGFTPEVVRRAGFVEAIERNVRIHAEMKKRGIRILPGGDYGFPWNPIGQNARDLSLFVELFGWTPAETLVAATRWGADLIGAGDFLGQVREGYTADLLLVRDDPLTHIDRMTDSENFIAIMQDGLFHKAPPGTPAGLCKALSRPLSVAI